MKKSIIIIGLLVVLAAAIGVYAVTREDSGKNTNNTSEEAGEGNIITYTDNGFSPATITIKAGDTITVVNESSEELDFKSNQHPGHSDNPELNQEDLVSGETQSFVVNEEGTWGYHNHHNPDKTGTIVVE